MRTNSTCISRRSRHPHAAACMLFWSISKRLRGACSLANFGPWITAPDNRPQTRPCPGKRNRAPLRLASGYRPVDLRAAGWCCRPAAHARRQMPVPANTNPSLAHQPSPASAGAPFGLTQQPADVALLMPRHRTEKRRVPHMGHAGVRVLGESSSSFSSTSVGTHWNCRQRRLSGPGPLRRRQNISGSSVPHLTA